MKLTTTKVPSNFKITGRISLNEPPERVDITPRVIPINPPIMGPR